MKFIMSPNVDAHSDKTLTWPLPPHLPDRPLLSPQSQYHSDCHHALHTSSLEALLHKAAVLQIVTRQERGCQATAGKEGLEHAEESYWVSPAEAQSTEAEESCGPSCLSLTRCRHSHRSSQAPRLLPCISRD